MLGKQYWGRAGPALVSLALASIGVELSTLADKTGYAPWLLGAEGLLFFIGCIMFFRRKLAATQGSSAEEAIELSDLDLASVLTTYSSQTDLQLARSTPEYYGKWIQLTGCLDNVTLWSGYSYSVKFQATDSLSGNAVEMQFNDRRKFESTLQLVRPGTTLVITGRVTFIGRQGIIIAGCRLMAIGQPARPTRNDFGEAF